MKLEKKNESDLSLLEAAPETAMRHNEGKPELRYVLCFGPALRALAETCANGAAKYSLYNFMKPTPVSLSFDCLLRHAEALWSGEDVDAEGNNHVGAMVFNVLQIGCNILNPAMDDRPKP